MIYQDITEVPYLFLKVALIELSEKYSIKNVNIDPNGELAIIVKGKLSPEDIQSIQERITPKDVVVSTPVYEIDYRQYESGMGYSTCIYSKENIDYTKL